MLGLTLLTKGAKCTKHMQFGTREVIPCVVAAIAENSSFITKIRISYRCFKQCFRIPKWVSLQKMWYRHALANIDHKRRQNHKKCSLSPHVRCFHVLHAVTIAENPSFVTKIRICRCFRFVKRDTSMSGPILIASYGKPTKIMHFGALWDVSFAVWWQ